MHMIYNPPTTPQPFKAEKARYRQRVGCVSCALCQGHEELLSQKMAAWVPSKDTRATWVLESTLFLAFASPQKEEAKVLAGGHGAGSGRSYRLCWLGLVMPMGYAGGGFRVLTALTEADPAAPAGWSRLRDSGRWVLPSVFQAAFVFLGVLGRKYPRNPASFFFR